MEVAIKIIAVLLVTFVWYLHYVALDLARKW